MASNPFETSNPAPGHGVISVAPFSSPTAASSAVLRELSYEYPLKLIAPPNSVIVGDHGDQQHYQVCTVFLLTYGGGIVAGDIIDLKVYLESGTRLSLLTQGSTKVFKSLDAAKLSIQYMSVDLERDATLCYLPEPVQPFEHSAFEQRQVYNLKSQHTNLCVCDWVCEGRPTRGEKWSFYSYVSRNEIWSTPDAGTRRLLLRDNVMLDSSDAETGPVVERMHGLGIFGTLIVRGILFERLARFFLDEFKLLPRIGAKQWDKGIEKVVSLEEEWRARRVEQEKKDGVLWTAAETRGCVVVKFGVKEVEGGKRWLLSMLKREDTVQREIGERALMCLK